ncbi:MAG: C-GCAxxG-C-C family protein [Bacteroidota bacterium]
MERPAQAKALFLSGHNCAQSVLLAFAGDLKFSKELALKMSAGFGGGMGKMQQTCGAVTGAIMVLGLLKGEHVNNNDELKSETYGSVKELSEKFMASFKTTSCSELTGCDLNSPGGAQKFKEERIMENVCAPCVEEAVRIVESMTM